MPPQPLQYARLTESNLKKHTKSFVDRIALQEQFILDYVLEQQVINNEKSQNSEKEHSLPSDSEKSKITSSGHSQYSIEHDLPSINGSLLISRNQLRKSKLSEIKESEPHGSRKTFPKEERIERMFSLEQRRDKPMKDKSPNINSNQRNRKSSKKVKKKCLQNKRGTSKADRHKSKKVNSLLASSQIMQNWSSDKLGTNRITLRSDNKPGLGIFNKGKASEKIKTKGVPDLVFSEIDFLNSNPPRKRKNQNEDDSGQKNGSFSSIRRNDLSIKLRKREQDMTRNSLQDTDEISSLYDSVCCNNCSTSAKKKKQEKSHSTKNLSEKRKKISNNKHYDKSKKSKQPRVSRMESNVASLSESSHSLLNEKSISSNNCSDASYSLVNKKTVYSPEHNHDKVSKLQEEQNIISSHFVEQENKSSKHASSHSDIHFLSNNNGHTSSPESSQKQRSRKDKQIISPYFASNQIKYKQAEREDNRLLTRNIESSPKPCSPVIDTSKQDISQKDSQVEEIASKYKSLSVQKTTTNDDDSKRLPVDESIKDFPEENDNNLCNERMDIHFDPTWVKRKSSLSPQLQNQKISNSSNKIKTYQSRRLSHAVISEGAKIGQPCRLAKEDCDNINNINIEFGNNEIAKNDEKIREIFAEDTNLEHMNVDLFNFGDAIQDNCQEIISNEDNCFNGRNQVIINDLNGFQDNNQSLYKSHYESSNGLTYRGIGEEFFEQEFAVDKHNFQDSNLYMLENLPYGENQPNFIPQTSALIQNQFLWSTNNESSNLINEELTQAFEVQDNKQSWDDYNSQYITAESVVCDHNDDPIENYDQLDVKGEIDSGITCFVWKKHRLH
ncbi:hypothetical protein GLOIN_2v1726679 [Rhizophagus clarus]|uniref:Uncharacterized protein n=1 Tax=Rhizophagus clarus TaxID=94130 RepID=A0A8H3M114_9GLOM|nr:hypothetical protein GLOIN_2v1726679 [Rhizophagus clarus]